MVKGLVTPTARIRSRTRLKDLEALQKEYATGQIFLDRLLDAYLKNLIVEEEYQRRKKEKEDALFLVKENIEGFEHRGCL